ncbi:hypothetical protein TWF718_000466 [Orbilia javanica]|uniref:Nucleoside phosphorylase domain-containing protein n=1 Tax=Orbilia javanica TaxID=47235 RepID=A0AAN8MTY4_9PEZI
MTTELRASDYSVGWICAIPIELAAVLAILDETYPQLDAADGDTNVYRFGRIGRHNVVISCLPEGRYGLTRAGIVAAHMRSTFSRLRFGLMVGVGGGAPSEDSDVRLGDLVISQPTGVSGGVIQYDFGKAMENGEFLRTGSLNAPPSILLSAVASIKAGDQAELGMKISDAAQKIEEENPRFQYPGQDTDRLFHAGYNHVEGGGRQRDTCKSCDASRVVPRAEREYDHPYIHYGIIASANQVMKDGMKRDRISAQTGALCFEMEAAGLMDDFPCLVIRGICDYSDGHKNKRWQPYAALVAAIYAKELLLQIPAASKDGMKNANRKREKIKEINFVIPFDLPFPRNRNFVGRVEKLAQVHEHFSKPNVTDTPRVFALVGTGGMGKTQVAIEYAYRHYYDYTAIFWVFAGSEDTIRTSFINIMQRIVKEQARVTWPESLPDYQAIGSKLGMPGSIDRKGTIDASPEVFNNIQSALFGWLQLPGNSRWLLIFDNADDLEAFDLQQYLPNSGGGAILVTSRRPEFSHRAEQVSLEGLDDKSAIKLLLDLAHLPNCLEAVETDAANLVKKLGFMPLAISHAGCYIYEAKLPLGGYLSYYNKAFMAVQSRKPKFGWNYRNDTAATTWEISFSRVEGEDKEAALLLLVCSYLNPEEICNDLWKDELASEVEIEGKILLLASYSLVKIIRPGLFSVHPVVHAWARERSDQSERFKTIKYAITILGNVSQRVNVSRESNKWEAREERRVASHLEYLHQYLNPVFPAFALEEQESKNQTLFDHADRIASVFENQGKYDEAMQWYDQALAGYKKILSEDHPLILSTIHNIASVFFRQDKYDEAMEQYERVLADKEKALGKDHLSTLDTVHGIAGVFFVQGNYDKAMQWYERALAGKEKALNKDDPSIFKTVSNIALIFKSQGKHDEAMQRQKQALTGYKKTLGEDHPLILITMNNIASVFKNQGKHDEAMQWYERALAGKEKALGKDHPSTFNTVNDIASAFFEQGKYNEAIQWYERELAGHEKALGKDHPSTLNTVYTLGLVFYNQGKYDEARQWYERALAGYERELAGHEKALGKDHPSTLSTVHTLGLVFYNQGKYDEARQWYERALAGYEKTLGKDHKLTLDTVYNIGLVFKNQGKYDEAMQWYERALIGYKKIFGEDHLLTADTVYNIGLVFFNQGKYDEAMQWYERALAGYEKALGKHHPSTLGTAKRLRALTENMIPSK